MKQNLDDPKFPRITYRHGAAGIPAPTIQGTGIRVQTVVIAKKIWKLTVEEIASEYDISKTSIRQALDFYQSHREEIDRAITVESELGPQ